MGALVEAKVASVGWSLAVKAEAHEGLGYRLDICGWDESVGKPGVKHDFLWLGPYLSSILEFKPIKGHRPSLFIAWDLTPCYIFLLGPSFCIFRQVVGAQNELTILALGQVEAEEGV